MRLHAQTTTIENGFVYLPEEAHWLADYMAELTMFPAGRHDDQVDSTAQALAWTKIRPPGWGIIEFYRMECERLNAPQLAPKCGSLRQRPSPTSRASPGVSTWCSSASSRSTAKMRRHSCAPGTGQSASESIGH